MLFMSRYLMSFTFSPTCADSIDVAYSNMLCYTYTPGNCTFTHIKLTFIGTDIITGHYNSGPTVDNIPLTYLNPITSNILH